MKRLRTHLRRCLWLAVVWSISAVPMAAASERASAFGIAVSVRISTDGRVEQAVVRPGLPDVLEQRVADAVAELRFDPPQRDGTPVHGVTHVEIYGCLSPQGERAELELFAMGSGPRLHQLHGIRAPSSLFRNVNAGEVALNLRFRVVTDGTAELVDLEMPDTLSERQKRDLHAAALALVTKLRFDAEEVNGEPVTTTLEWPMTIEYRRVSREPGAGSLTTTSRWRDPRRKATGTRSTAINASTRASHYCESRTPRKERWRPTMAVLDSPFRLRR